MAIGVAGSLVAALIMGWLTRTRVEFLGFTSVEIAETAGTGTLYKVAFRVRGRSPGSSCLEIRYPSPRGRRYEAQFAKWDEAANPLDQQGRFLQWLVPLGYYQPLVPGRVYISPSFSSATGGRRSSAATGLVRSATSSIGQSTMPAESTSSSPAAA